MSHWVPAASGPVHLRPASAVNDQACPPSEGHAFSGRSKLDLVGRLLSRAGGASLNEITKETGWLQHTIRAAITRLRQRGLRIEYAEVSDGCKVYRISGGAKSEWHVSAAEQPRVATTPERKTSPLSKHIATVDVAKGSTTAPHYHSNCSKATCPDAPANDWRTALSLLEGAYSGNTIRCYGADFRIFELWCVTAGRSALPATPETVAEFLRAQSKNAAPATVSRRRAAIGKIYKLLKLENPVSAEEVNLATRSVFRLKGRRQKQALGLVASLKSQLIKACPKDLRGLRDRALIAAGYDTLCRRSELVALRIEDLAIAPDGSGTILVRKAKTDQQGHGRLAYLSAEAVTSLERWQEAAGLHAGPIFRHVAGNMVLECAISAKTVSDILKNRAAKAGIAALTVKRLSGHSMRVGAAQDMAAGGIDLGAIMHAGGWKSPEMVMRYIEHMDVAKSGMARLYGGAA